MIRPALSPSTEWPATQTTRMPSAIDEATSPYNSIKGVTPQELIHAELRFRVMKLWQGMGD